MVSIGKLSAGQERYYLEQAGERVDAAASLGDGAEDYYLDPSEARGEWVGTAAARLGLSGSVGAQQLRLLLSGRHPSSDTVLVERGPRARVSAFDVTFSAPKSVSIFFGLGDEGVSAEVRAAHQLAVGEAFGYLERSAAAVRRGHNGLTVLPAHGFVAAAFRHRASRAGDPQLHTHVVIANLGCGPDGRWSALDGRRIYAHARAASAVYQAVLRGELTHRLGVEWTATTRGIAEVRGVPLPLRRAFSRRRVEIERALAEHRTSSGPAAEAAALATRNAKHQVNAAELRGEWRRRADALGFDRQAIAQLIGTGARRRLDEDLRDRLVQTLLQPDGLTASQSSFTRRDVLVAICDRLPSGTGVRADELERLIDRTLAHADVAALAGDTPALERVPRSFRRRDGRVLPVAAAEQHYTTAELLTVEQRLLRLVEAGRPAGAGIADPHLTAKALTARPALAAEQVEMVRRLLLDGHGVAVVSGRAGTGKTFALDAAREAWQASGHEVIGAAVARRAAAELEHGAGIPSTSVHSLLRRPLPNRAVVVIDEAGMLGTRQLTQLAERVQSARGKLVLVGDHRQLPEIDAGGAFRALTRRPDAIRLEENRRQTEPWERQAVDHLRSGRAEAALDLYQHHGRLAIADTTLEAHARLVADWWTAGDHGQALMIAARRREVDELNRLARRRMRDAGQLTGADVTLLGRSFARGDRVVIRRNHQATGAHNGDLGHITEIGRDGVHVRLDRRDSAITLPIAFLVDRDALAHGYAVTGHVAQGLTVDRTYVLANHTISREWAYVAMTRGRHANRLYTASDSQRDEYAPAERHRHAREQLAIALQRSEAEPLALERRSGRGIEL